MKNKIFRHLILGSVCCCIAATLSLLTACNDEWKEEQYQHYISFKAPLNDNGVTAVYVPYTRHNDDGTPMYGEGKSHYELPVIVSGTTDNDEDITVYVGHSDTLSILNVERFGSPAYRADITDLYYKDMSQFASYSETLKINAGKNVELLKINFDFNGIDMRDKWVLPIEIKKHEGYTPHPRKNYAKAMLRVYPYNDFSGNYSATTLTVTNADDPDNATGMETARGYVVDENTIFFYAGTMNEESRVDRQNYKVFFHFIPENAEKTQGRIEITSNNPANGFVNNGQAAYRIYEQMDEVQPWLMHRYVIISGIDYNYTDYTSVEGYPMEYTVKGILTLERQLNTQIPNEDQAIQW
ncbi:MAG: DUF4973 domain-containing protein [Bacteroidaceae bacterium]|nr:DUF4973 domain-containing protein [Bacteroidaceae bacterium]